MTERADYERVALGRKRFVWHDGTLWFRTYTEGGYDGYRTLFGRMAPCGHLADRIKEARRG